MHRLPHGYRAQAAEDAGRGTEKTVEKFSLGGTEDVMSAPIFAALLAVLGGLLLVVSAFLGVTPAADWTIFGAEASLVVAAVVFLGWFIVGCIAEIRSA
jgi:hypothetical protein